MNKWKMSHVIMILLSWVLLSAGTCAGGCVAVPSGSVTVKIISPTVDNGGFCSAKIVVANSGAREFPLLSVQGVYPELDVRVYNKQDKTEKTLTRSGANCFGREQGNSRVINIRPFATVQLNMAFDLQDYDAREKLMICVASPSDRSHRIQADIVHVLSGPEVVGKGSDPYPRLSGEDILNAKKGGIDASAVASWCGCLGEPSSERRFSDGETLFRLDDFARDDFSPTNGKVQTATVEVGRTISFVLEENSTTGYRWELADPEVNGWGLVTFNYQGRPKDTDGEFRCGASGRVTVTVKPSCSGDYPIRLVYRRRWERKPPIALVDVVVRAIGNKKDEVGNISHWGERSPTTPNYNCSRIEQSDNSIADEFSQFCEGRHLKTPCVAVRPGEFLV